MTCQKCGTKLEEGTRFCTNCGAAQQQEEQNVQSTEAPKQEQEGAPIAESVTESQVMKEDEAPTAVTNEVAETTTAEEKTEEPSISSSEPNEESSDDDTASTELGTATATEQPAVATATSASEPPTAVADAPATDAPAAEQPAPATEQPAVAAEQPAAATEAPAAAAEEPAAATAEEPAAATAEEPAAATAEEPAAATAEEPAAATAEEPAAATAEEPAAATAEEPAAAAATAEEPAAATAEQPTAAAATPPPAPATPPPAPATPPPPAPVGSPAPQVAQTSETVGKPKSGMFLKIAIPVIILALVAVGFYFFNRGKSNQEDALAIALENLGEEAKHRISNTPFNVFSKLSECLQDGSVTVDVSYLEHFDNYPSDEYRAVFSIASNIQEREIALTAMYSFIDNYYEYMQKYEVEAFMNKERIAIGSKMLDDNYYGIRYSTFAEDIWVFAAKFGIDTYTVNSIIEMVDAINEGMNAAPERLDYSERSEDMLQKYADLCEYTTKSIDLDTVGKTGSGTQYELLISKAAIMAFFEDVIDMMETDEDIQSILEQLYVSVPGNESVNVGFDEILEETKNLIAIFDQVYSDTSVIRYTFVVSDEDRLVNMDIDLDIRVDLSSLGGGNERLQMSISYDFGTSLMDPWVFNIDITNIMSVGYIWDYKELSGGVYENTLTMNVDYQTLVFETQWTRSSGDFTISFRDNYGYFSGELTGNYRIADDGVGFVFSVDRFAMMDGIVYDDFEVAIIGEKGANIKDIEFINIDKWELELFERLMIAFSGQYIDLGEDEIINGGGPSEEELAGFNPVPLPIPDIEDPAPLPIPDFELPDFDDDVEESEGDDEEDLDETDLEDDIDLEEEAELGNEADLEDETDLLDEADQIDDSADDDDTTDDILQGEEDLPEAEDPPEED